MRLRRRNNKDTPQQDIGQTSILKLGETRLLLEVEADLSSIQLDLTEVQSELVVALVGDPSVRRELEEVVRLELDNVGEDVGSLENQVLDHEIHLLVGIFDSRKRNIAHLVDQRGAGGRKRE